MESNKIKTVGFGFNPNETEHHFLIEIPPGNGSIRVYERFYWDEEEQKRDINDKNLRVIISKSRFNTVRNIIQKFLNERLKQDGLDRCKFETGLTPIERLLGKEIMVLLWAIEDADVSLFKIAVKNWLGFTPEEKWWLFTMTNASTGYYDNKIGWRIALRYALTTNPVTTDTNTPRNILEEGEQIRFI